MLDRSKTALLRSNQVVSRLRMKGVDIRITGSLANGRFCESSDVDFLVLSCPSKLKYAIESDVEDCLIDIPFDVIYLEEIKNDAYKKSLMAETL